MSRIVPAAELDLIEQVISEHVEGIGISALEKALQRRLPKPLTRRTLQRRLESLLTDGRITTAGESIALVYRRAPDAMRARLAGSAKAAGRLAPEAYIPISREGTIIRDLVRQPLIHRQPVGYQRTFLEEYEPGVTFYLS